MKKALGWMGRLGVALALIFGVALSVAAPASAAEITTLAASADPVSTGVSSPIVKMADDADPVDMDDIAIPMMRWNGATQSFNYMTDGNPVGAAARASERTIYYAFPMMIGNAMWMGSSSLLEGAVQFKPMQIVGLQIDKAAAGIGKAIMSSPLITLAFVVVALGTVFALKRGGNESPWKRVLSTVGVAAMFVIMVAGAGNSTETTSGGKTQYVPGYGSPGWFLTSIQTTTATITGTVADSLDIPSFDTDDYYSCGKYVTAVKNLNPREYSDSSIIPMASALWTQTGLEAWKLAQFGNSSYANYAYCHVLDWSNPKGAVAVLDSLDGYPDAVATSAALSPKDADQRDRSAIAWAVCSPNEAGDWGTRAPWFSTDEDDGSTIRWGRKDSRDKVDGDNEKREDYGGPDGFCNEWWTAPAADWNSDRFRVGPNANDVTDFVAGETTVKQQVSTFLMNWQGADNSGIAVTLSYSVASFIISVVFLIVAAAMFFVNIAVVATLLSIFIVMLVVLFTKNDVGTRLVGFVKNLIGLVVFSAVAGLLIAMLAKIIEVLGMVGKEIFAEAPLAVMLWVGISPLLALVMLHFIFTKLLRVPSPFKLSSALAWGAAAGAAGGAAGAGVSNMMSRGEKKVENAVKSAPGAALRKGKDAIFNKGDKRDGAATAAVDSTSKKHDALSADGTEKKEKTALERREERKAAKAELKEARNEARGVSAGADKNKGYLSKMDRLLGGHGELGGAATTGWRGAVNSVAGKLGAKDLLSDRDSDKMGLAGNLMADAGDAVVSGTKNVASAVGGNLRSVPKKMVENARESMARYGEMWHENKGAAVKQTLKTAAKYGALGIGTALTGGAVAVGYAGYRAAKSAAVASRDVHRQNDKSALDAFREQKAQQQRQQAPAPQQRQPQPTRRSNRSSGGADKPSF